MMRAPLGCRRGCNQGWLGVGGMCDGGRERVVVMHLGQGALAEVGDIDMATLGRPLGAAGLPRVAPKLAGRPVSISRGEEPKSR